MSSQYIPWAAATDKGKLRADNQDYFLARPELGLWVVCDGLGGHAGGAAASRTAAEKVVKEVEGGRGLREAVMAAHEKVRMLPFVDPALIGGRPATTIACLRVLPGGYSLIWVGDTKGFSWDGEAVVQLTRDHSFVQQLVDEGRIDPLEKAVHPFKGVLTSALGLDRGKLEPGEEASTWNPMGQAIILATDGLDYLGGELPLSKLLAKADGPDSAVRLLINAALDAGGVDNVTVAVIGWPHNRSQRPIRRSAVFPSALDRR